MASAKLTALTEDTTPTSDDLLYTVNDPTGTPAERKSTILNVVSAGISGTQTKFISAAAMYPGGANPATGVVTKQFGANNQPIQAVEFPDGADYECYIQDVLDNWDAGTIKVKYYWFRENDEATPESKTIEFECSGVSLANFAAIGGTAYGTAIAVTDTTDATAAEDKINITAASTAITIAGAGEGEWISLKIMRDDSAGTLTGSIFLAGIAIEYTINAGTSTV